MPGSTAASGDRHPHTGSEFPHLLEQTPDTPMAKINVLEMYRGCLVYRHANDVVDPEVPDGVAKLYISRKLSGFAIHRLGLGQTTLIPQNT
jgi:hypothetical protein